MNDQQFESLLYDSLHPQIDSWETQVHYKPIRKGNNMNKVIKKACMIAAAVAILTTSVYAAGELTIKTLRSGKTSRIYDSVRQAEEKAGFEMDDVACFSNGYGFTGARVGQTEAMDEKDKVRLVYNEINVELENDAGERIVLIAHEYQEGIVASSLPPEQTRKIGEITLEYRLHHYKFVPEDYVRTEADKVWLQQPGNFMSYGSDTVEENEVAFLNWEKNGICYTLMDSDGSEPAQSLFSMAGELINSST